MQYFLDKFNIFMELLFFKLYIFILNIFWIKLDNIWPTSDILFTFLFSHCDFYYNFVMLKWELNILNIWYFFIILILIYFLDILKIFILSKVRCKKIDLNPRFWLIYLKFIPIISIFSSLVFWVFTKNFNKKTLLNIMICDSIYIWIILLLNIFKIDEDYIRLSWIIIFWILYIWEILVKWYLNLRKKIF